MFQTLFPLQASLLIFAIIGLIHPCIRDFNALNVTRISVLIALLLQRLYAHTQPSQVRAHEVSSRVSFLIVLIPRAKDLLPYLLHCVFNWLGDQCLDTSPSLPPRAEALPPFVVVVVMMYPCVLQLLLLPTKLRLITYVLALGGAATPNARVVRSPRRLHHSHAQCARAVSPMMFCFVERVEWCCVGSVAGVMD